MRIRRPTTGHRHATLVYFDNDVKVRSPFDAATLALKLGLRDDALCKGGHEPITEVPRTNWPAV